MVGKFALLVFEGSSLYVGKNQMSDFLTFWSIKDLEVSKL